MASGSGPSRGGKGNRGSRGNIHNVPREGDHQQKASRSSQDVDFQDRENRGQRQPNNYSARKEEFHHQSANRGARDGGYRDRREGDNTRQNNGDNSRRVRYEDASRNSQGGGFRDRVDSGYQRQSHKNNPRGGGYHNGADNGSQRGNYKGFRTTGFQRGGSRGGRASHFPVESIDVPKLKTTDHPTEYVKRPGRSTCTNKITVDTNYYQLKSNLNIVVRHYDIHLSKAQRGPVVKVTDTEKPLSKAIYKEVLIKFFENVLPQHTTSYIHDGMHNFYTIQKLPLPKDQYEDDEFQLTDRQIFVLKVKKVAIINLNVLNDNNPSKEIAIQKRTALSVIDIYLKYRYASNGSHIMVGRNLFDAKNGTSFRCFGDYSDQHLGRELLFGKLISTRKVEGGVAILADTTAAAFITFEGTAAEFIRLKLNMDPNNLSDRDWFTIQQSLKGLQYTVDHFGYPRKFIADGLSKTATNNDVFEWTEKNGAEETSHGKVSVTEYFRRKYNKQLKYGHSLPCLTSKGDRKFPLELCKISPQKIAKSKLTSYQEGMMVRHAAQVPAKKWEEVQKNVKELVSATAEIITEFKIDPSLVPWKLEAVVLNPPKLLYANNRPANVDNGTWNLKEQKLRNGGLLEQWAVINFSYGNVDELIEKLQNVGIKMGMNIPNCSKVIRGEYREGQLKKFMNANLPNSKIDLIIFVINSKDKSTYREIKRVCDTEMGIANQCIKEDTLRKINDHICANLLLKINIRLKGINHVLETWDISVKPDKNDCMMFGADVTHPGEGDEIFCSIAAVVGSFDKELSQYGAELRAQKKNKIGGGATEEMIEHIGDMVKNLLQRFHAKNKKYPEKIIFFRDGVSDGQYLQVKHREIDAILAMLKALNPSQPRIKLTFVICGKRMKAKVKPHDAKDMKGRSGNVPSGTTIDVGIVDPINFDFYQVPHEGIQGTSIPTHFFVLHDDNKLSVDDLEKLTFYLCHTYGRCTRSISDPAPARYAHDAAYRCRDISISKFQGRLKMSQKANETIEEFENRKIDQVNEVNRSIQVPEELCMFFI